MGLGHFFLEDRRRERGVVRLAGARVDLMRVGLVREAVRPGALARVVWLREALLPGALVRVALGREDGALGARDFGCETWVVGDRSVGG